MSTSSESSDIVTEILSDDLSECNSCCNCSVLKCEILELSEHVDELTKLLDHLSSIRCADSNSVTCEAYTQTDDLSTEPDSDALFHIYLNSNTTQPHAPQPVQTTRCTEVERSLPIQLESFMF